MATPDWSRIKGEFDRLQALGKPQRAVALAGLRTSDPVLAEELESLLDQSDQAQPWFEQLEAELADQREAELDTAWAQNRLVGPYQLESLIGSGGMGAVFLARKADGELQRPVALKLIPSDWLPEDSRQRLAHERDILASLSHPNIAHLHDAGVDDDGQAWLAMEFVDGQQIDLWCEQASPSLNTRLRVFLDLCLAVAMAHRHLIVHGDIKPSNVLLDRDQRVRLLDFGISEIIQAQKPTSASFAPGARYYSPGFSSPEQAAGQPPSVSTDVFALGRMLGVLTADQNTENHELAAIIGKACNQDPERRFQSVTRLIDQIEALLSGRAVDSYSTRPAYRLGKWLRRHRLTAAFSSLFLISIVAFSAQSRYQAELFRAERDKASQLSGFLESVLTAADPEQARGQPLTAFELLERGTENAQNLPVDPNVRSEFLTIMARSYQRLGHYPQALELFERVRQAHQAAELPLEEAATRIALAETHYANGDYLAAESEFAAALTLLQNSVGDRSLELRSAATAGMGQVKMRTGEPETGQDLLSQAMTLAGPLRESRPEHYSELLNDAASGHWQNGESTQALTLINQALEVRRQLDRDRGMASPRTATLISNAGLMHYLSGQFEPAQALFEEALSLRRRLLPETHPEIAQTLTNYGLMLKDFQHTRAAVGHLTEALTIRERTLRPDHINITEAHLNLATALRSNGQLDESEHHFEVAINGLEEHFGSNHRSVAVAYSEHAALLLDRGDAVGAERQFRQAQSIRDEVLPSRHPHHAWSLLGLGRSLLAQGRTEDARAPIERAVDLRQTLPVDHPLRIEAEQTLALLP